MGAHEVVQAQPRPAESEATRLTSSQYSVCRPVECECARWLALLGHSEYPLGRCVGVLGRGDIRTLLRERPRYPRMAMAFPDPSGFLGQLSFVSEDPMELYAQLRYEVPLEKVEREDLGGPVLCVLLLCVTVMFCKCSLVWLKVARKRRVLRMCCP